MNYFPLMYCYGINANILHVTFSRVEYWSFHIIFTGISNDKTDELTIYGILCQNITIFYRQELASLFQVQEILKACRSSKLNFSSSCFNADDSLVNIVWIRRVVVFSKHDTLHFWDNVHLLKFHPVKVLQNYFNSFIYSNQTCIQVPKFSFALDK